MKEMKKLLTLAVSGAIVAVPAVSMAATVTPTNEAENSPLTINSVDIKTSADDATIAEDCVKFTVSYTGTLDAETKQQTVLGLNSNASLDDPAAANIVWIDQDAQSGTIEFLVKKTKLKANLYLKVGGTDIEIPQLITLNTADYSVMPSYDAPAISVGDVKDDDANITVTYPAEGPASWASVEDTTLSMDVYKSARKTINVKDASGKAVLTQTADFDAIALDSAKMDAALADNVYSGTFTLEIVAGTDDFNFAPATATFTYTSETKKEAIEQAAFEAAAAAVEIVTATEDEENAKYTIAIAAEKDGYTATLKSITVDGTDKTADVVSGALDVAQDEENSKAVVVVYEIAKDGRTTELTKNITVPKVGGGAPELDMAKTKLYDQEAPFDYGDGDFLRVFIKENGADGSEYIPSFIPKHVNSESVFAYSVERKGFDCLIKTDKTTIEDILAEITWEEGTLTDDMIIKTYGDANITDEGVRGDELIDADDAVIVKRFVLGKGEAPTAMQLLTLDLNNDGFVDADDANDIKKTVLGRFEDGEVFKIVEDR